MQAASVFASALFLIAISGVSSRFHHGMPALTRSRRSADIDCNENRRFRTFDGQCNNLENTRWGSVGQHFERIAPAAYGPDVPGSSPRVNGIDGTALPPVREVSIKVHPSDSTTDDVTLMVMQWGQFLDHDVTFTAEAEEENGDHVSCECSSSNELCFNIPIDRNTDEHFTNTDCLEFARSEGELVENSETNEKVLEQTNVITAFVDASQVYSSSREQSLVLRVNNRRGSMRVTRNRDNSPLLPEDPAGGCIIEGDAFCQQAGDLRVNEMPGLGALHTIFVREHNRIARFFRQNTEWGENRIFQETRKIIGAIMQHISYSEYLPTVLSPAIIDQFNLDPSSCFTYDPNVRPDIINGFATAAFRFGHSQIPEGVNHGNQFFALRDLFSRPLAVIDRFDNVTGALAKDLSMTSDGLFARSVTRHLVLGPGQSETDLISRNLQRGRDHGLPSYNEFRAACDLDRITSFSELSDTLDGVYKSVEDIDLFTGAMLEQRLDESLLGPTFSCILGKQFEKLKTGDRFFYTTRDENTRFSRAQLRQIRKITLSKIICVNSENKMIQPNIFFPADNGSNSLLRCGQIPQINLRRWIEPNN